MDQLKCNNILLRESKITLMLGYDIIEVGFGTGDVLKRLSSSFKTAPPKLVAMDSTSEYK